jgi:large subunit ribosomal protein L13
MSIALILNRLGPLYQTALAYARVWHHADAKDRILGKLAERIAIVLMGKHKPIYDPSGMFLPFSSGLELWLSEVVDCGDYVVVTNASQVKVTGRKADQILYRKHSLYPGGLKEIKYRDMMDKKPDEVRRPLVSL